MKCMLLSLALLAVPFSVAEAQGGQQVVMTQKTLPLSADTTGLVAVPPKNSDAQFDTLDGDVTIIINHFTDAFYQYEMRDDMWDAAAYFGKGDVSIKKMTVDFIGISGKEWGRLMYNYTGTHNIEFRIEQLTTSVDNRKMLILIISTSEAYKKNAATIRRFVNSLRPL